MKTLVIVSGLILASCATAQTPVQTPVPPPVQTAVQPQVQTAPSNAQGQVVIGGDQTPVAPLVDPRTFICSDGHRAVIDHDRPAGILRVQRGGEMLALQEQVGRTPPRFVTGSDGLDLDGGTATILRGFGDRATPVATCGEIPAQPTRGLIWGTLTKLDRTALPEGTRAKVLLVDAARADAPAVEIASTAITTRGNQVPLHFRLAYGADAVVPRSRTYRLQGRIEGADGKLMYITDTATFVLEGAEPQPPVELRLVRASGQ